MIKLTVKGSLKETDIIELSGDFTEKNINEIKDKFYIRIKTNIKNVVLLCKNIKRIDSSGASLLAEISHELKKIGGQLYLVDCPSSIEIMIKFMGVDHLFQLYKTEADVCNFLGISQKDFMFSATGRALKRQISLRDTLRNQTIIVQYNQTMKVSEILDYLQKNYVHLRNIEIQLSIGNKKLPDTASILDLFNKYNYSESNLIKIEQEKEVEFDNVKAKAEHLVVPLPKLNNFDDSLVNPLNNSDGLVGEGTVVDEEYVQETGWKQQIEIKENLVYQNQVELEISHSLTHFLEKTISQLKQAEESLQVMLQLANSFTQNKNFNETLFSLLHTMHKFASYAYGIVLLYDRKVGELVTKSIKNNEEDSYQKTMISKQMIQNIEEKRCLIMATPENNDRAHIVLPILSGKQLLGMVYLIGYGNKKYTKETLSMLSAIINYSALAIENALLIHQLESATYE